EGSRNVAISREGDLTLETDISAENVRLRKPVVYQLVKGSRVEIAAEYVLSAAHEVSFKVGAYDNGSPLVIDPVLSYSTYLGGSSYDLGYCVAVDSSGDVYVTGIAYSTDFPTVNSLQPSFGGGAHDAFVAKLTPAGALL